MLSKKDLKLLEKVTQIDAVSGNEKVLAGFLQSEFSKLGYTLVKDNLGSLFALKKGKGENLPRVMVASHMDEVGFCVLDIKENGLIYAEARGGISPNTLLSQRLRLRLDNGSFLYGSVGALAPHLGGSNTNNVNITDLDFDFGFANKKEAIEAGIKTGLTFVVDGPFKVLNNGKRLLSKAFDNRYGVFMTLKMAYAFKDIDLPYDLYFGATVQEEVGLRGAKTIAHVINPDLVIALDCSPARDTIGKDEEGQLGGGLLLRYLDRSMIAFPELIAFQEKCAAQAKAKTQYYSSMGGTDAGAFHLHAEGVLTLTHCICARSLHTAATVVDTGDIVDAEKTLKVLLKNLNSEVIRNFKEVRR